MATYIPDRGDLIWLDFMPQSGHEQSGRRPAIVLSPGHYNRKTSLAICCPITSHVKKYPFEVQLNCKKISGVILSDHIKSLDWKERNAVFIEKANQDVLDECIAKISAIIIL